MSEEDTVRNLLHEWPDGYSRFYSISHILAAAYGSKPITVLDVGGNRDGLPDFLNAASVTATVQVVDPRPSIITNPDVQYHQGDVLALSDGLEHSLRSDVVISTDVLEHVAEARRLAFLIRCVDLAGSLVLIAAPHKADVITVAENAVNTTHKLATGKDHPWLLEHSHYGLPEFSPLLHELDHRNLPYAIVDTNNLFNWHLSLTLNVIADSLGCRRDVDELNAWYNSNIGEVGDFDPPTYRKVVVVVKDESLLDRVAEAIPRIFAAGSDAVRMDYTSRVVGLLAERLIATTRDSKELAALRQTKWFGPLLHATDAYMRLRSAMDRVVAELHRNGARMFTRRL